MQTASALDKGMLQCTQPSDVTSVVPCGVQPRLEFCDSSSAHDPAAAMWWVSSMDGIFAQIGVVGTTEDYINVWTCRKRHGGHALHAQRGVD